MDVGTNTMMILSPKETHKRTYEWNSNSLDTGHFQLKIKYGHPSGEKPFRGRCISQLFLEGRGPLSAS